jgi:hypothetical protein
MFSYLLLTGMRTGKTSKAISVLPMILRSDTNGTGCIMRSK